MQVPYDAGQEWKRGTNELPTSYQISTEQAGIEEYIEREREIVETETRWREAAVQEDERVDIVQLEVAGTVLTLTQREAAVVVYCPEEWARVEILCKGVSAWRIDRLRTKTELSATVVGRPLGNRTTYAAVFPRFRPISYTGWHEGLRNTKFRLWAEYRESAYEGYYEAYLGNVTEVDWTTPPSPMPDTS